MRLLLQSVAYWIVGIMEKFARIVVSRCKAVEGIVYVGDGLEDADVEFYQGVKRILCSGVCYLLGKEGEDALRKVTDLNLRIGTIRQNPLGISLLSYKTPARIRTAVLVFLKI
jgi:hypothetical protein